MKIAFILSDAVLLPSNGVVVQAKTWRNGLEELGHKVDLIDMWKEYKWEEYDAIVYFHYSVYMSNHIEGLYDINKNIYVAPILDPSYSVNRLKIYARWGISFLKLTNHYHSFFKIRHKIKGILVRSEFEKQYMIDGFGFSTEKCFLVPISFDISNNLIVQNNERENFCLHISLLADKRKNVKRLIDAATKYDFKLVLAGKLRNKDEISLINSWLKKNPNTEYVGYLSEEEKQQLYSKAKVFALPSTNEGVGIVGLEASAMGCDIVMTNIGGPKEYYNGLAEFVTPYNVDDIGQAVMKLMNGTTHQPELRQHIEKNYSVNNCSLILEGVLRS